MYGKSATEKQIYLAVVMNFIVKQSSGHLFKNNFFDIMVVY